MRIQHNIAALNSYRQLGTNNTAISKNLEKLSSGYKINRAGDDAAGLAISEKMRAQITGLETAQKNANDGISLVQTAEGALTEVHDMLNRMVELATQSANGIYDDTDRQKLQAEVDALASEIDRIADSTDFNGIKLLNGTDLGAGAAGTPAKSASFEVDLSSITTVSANNGDNFKLTISGVDIESNNASTTITNNASDLAALFEGSTATISGVDYTVTVSGTKLTFTADNPGAATAVADATGVTIAKGTNGSGTVTDPNGIQTSGAKNGADEVKGTGGRDLQIGATEDDTINVTIDNMDSQSLGVKNVAEGTGIDISTDAATANEAIDTIKTAIDTVSTQRGKLGAIQNRLEHTINNLGVTTENITSAESRIRDTDMADEMMAYTKNNILVQASQAMLAQANTLPQGVLQLLQ